MSFKDKNYNIKPSYLSCGEDSITKFINPLLSETKIYARSVGYFRSSALTFLEEGINSLIKNHGKIRIATSPDLSPEDIDAISLGYQKREEIIKKKFCSELNDVIAELKIEKLDQLSMLIENGILDVKIVTKKDGGMYHDKLAVLTDFDDNKVVFVGSSNETGNGLKRNYEKIRTFKSWHDEDGHVTDETKEFNSIWNNSNVFLNVYNFDDAIKQSIVKARQNVCNCNIKMKLENVKIEQKSVYKPPRPYQQEAINNWVNNEYKGFYVMATGTGKTITALHAIEKLFKEKGPILAVIAVPYKHLIAQWNAEVEQVFPKDKIIKVSSEFNKWEINIQESIISNELRDEKHNIIVITTIVSFNLPRFTNIIDNSDLEKLLVVDEAHNFINYIDNAKLKITYKYKLGLSATPVFGKDKEKTKKLLDFFGGKVYSLPLEKAIGKYLVEYNYYPIFVHSSEDEEKQFNYHTQQMMSCRDKYGKIINKDKFFKEYTARLRVISTISEKTDNVSSYIDQLKVTDHFIIYCSDGKLYNNSQKEIRNIQNIIKILNSKGYYPSKFTADESMDKRMSLIESFTSGDISALAAIRCLDEGVDIPSITTALIISSNNKYREFVQRRGRILRKCNEIQKKEANIYDLVVLPSNKCSGIAKIELSRFFEYAKLAKNFEIGENSNKKILNNLLNRYGLDYSDIKIETDYNEEEEELDE